MTFGTAGRSVQWNGPALAAAARRVVLLGRQNRALQTKVAFFGLALLMGVILGVLVVHVPPIYLLFGLGGVVFAFLLLFKIEIAILVAILLRNWLGEFNYLGGGTPLHPNGMIGIAIIAGAAVFFLFNRIDFSRLRAFWPFLIFAAIYLVSIVRTGQYLMDGLTVVLRLLTALAIYAVLVYKLDSTKKINWLILAIIAAQILPTVEGLIGVAQGGGMGLDAAGIVRSGHSGQGAFLAMILAFCLVQLMDASTTRRRLLWGFVTGLFAFGLFFSYGRAGWIGFGVTAVVIGLMKRSKLLIVLPVILILLITLLPTAFQRFADIDLEHLDDRNRSSSTLAGRIEMWRASAQVWETQPWLGVGYGVGRHEVEEYAGRMRMATMLHNDYLAVLVATGLIGLTAFLLWQGQWLVELLKVHRMARHAYDKTLALAVFAMFFASLVVRITDNVIETTDKLYPLVALVAAALALPQIRAKEEAQSSDRDLSKGQPDARSRRNLRSRAATSSHLPGEDSQQPLPSGRKVLASGVAAGDGSHPRGSRGISSFGRNLDIRPEARRPLDSG